MHQTPSVRLLLDPILRELLQTHVQVEFLQQIAHGCDLLDEALQPLLESGASMAQLALSDVTADEKSWPLVTKALSQFRSEFAALAGMSAAGKLLQGRSFWEAARAAALNPRSKAGETAVFYQINLEVLRVAAEAPREAYPSPSA